MALVKNELKKEGRGVNINRFELTSLEATAIIGV
jgi:hypothetical protein